MCVRGERREWEWVCDGKEDGFAVNHHLYVSYLGWERGWLCCEPSSLCIILGVGKRKALL